jgi:hypothetical protein
MDRPSHFWFRGDRDLCFVDIIFGRSVLVPFCIFQFFLAKIQEFLSHKGTKQEI